MKLNPYQHLPEYPMAPTAHRRLLAYQAGENGYTLNFMFAAKGTKAPPHSHPHLQVVYVLSGSGIFRCGEETAPMKAGDVLQIDGGVPHTWEEVFEDIESLEFFTPEREDFAPEE